MMSPLQKVNFHKTAQNRLWGNVSEKILTEETMYLNLTNFNIKTSYDTYPPP